MQKVFNQKLYCFESAKVIFRIYIICITRRTSANSNINRKQRPSFRSDSLQKERIIVFFYNSYVNKNQLKHQFISVIKKGEMSSLGGVNRD